PSSARCRSCLWPRSSPCFSPSAPPSLVFLSHSSAPHRPLPSFPTRRSSDLLRPGRRRDGQPVLVGGARRVEGAGRVAVGELLERDRKSTRLNSSHVKISYAVFCLKKKKRNSNKMGVRGLREPRTGQRTESHA